MQLIIKGSLVEQVQEEANWGWSSH